MNWFLYDIGLRHKRVNFRFSSRNSRSQQKLEKKITHFTIQFHSKTHFTNLNSLSIVKNILLLYILKPTHFANFPGNIFLVGIRKNIYTAPFLGAQELYSRIPVNLRKKTFVPQTEEAFIWWKTE